MPNQVQYKVQESTYGGNFREIAEPFIVPTPQPYVVSLTHHRDEAAKEAAKQRLLESCQLLHEILTLLGIPLKEAYAANYTLNLDTRDRLLAIAWAQENEAAADKLHSRKW